MKKIDALDTQILNLLIQDARLSYQDIADQCSLSRAAVHQRIRRLIERGIIIGSGFHVNYSKLGLKTFTYIGIGLEKGSLYNSVCAELEKISEITECNFTTGNYNMLIKLYVRDNDHLMQILNDQIQVIPGVRTTETLISLKQSFNRPYLLKQNNEEEEEE